MYIAVTWFESPKWPVSHATLPTPVSEVVDEHEEREVPGQEAKAHIARIRFGGLLAVASDQLQFESINPSEGVS